MKTGLEILLLPLSVLYRAGVGIRRSLYQTGIFKSHDVGAPVISVGNLTTGGTGKTPIVERVAGIIAESGARVCVLTRGYSRQNPKSRVLVSDYEKIYAAVEESGDEAYLLAKMLLGKAAVVCDRDRVSAALWAKKELGSEVFVLDDGFQHLQIARTLNICVIDATNPWGGGRLLPAGRLREPVNQLARADVVILSKSNLVDDVSGIVSQVKALAPSASIFQSKFVSKHLTDLSGDAVPDLDLEKIKSRKVVAFCGLGNPSSFFEQLRFQGWIIGSKIAFKDHYQYSQSDVDAMTMKARASESSALITTAKDAVKLRGFQFDIPCYVANVAMTFDDEECFTESILKAVHLGSG